MLGTLLAESLQRRSFELKALKKYINFFEQSDAAYASALTIQRNRKEPLGYIFEGDSAEVSISDPPGGVQVILQHVSGSLQEVRLTALEVADLLILMRESAERMGIESAVALGGYYRYRDNADEQGEDDINSLPIFYCVVRSRNPETVSRPTQERTRPSQKRKPKVGSGERGVPKAPDPDKGFP